MGYISTYFYIFTTKVWHFCHRLPQKCVVLLQIATKVWYFTTVYRYLPHKCGILLQFDTKVWLENVPQNGVQTNYVPQVPHVGYRWGTKTSTPQDGKYLIFFKNLTQKCGILLQFDTKVWARNVPQNEAQTNYV